MKIQFQINIILEVVLGGIISISFSAVVGTDSENDTTTGLENGSHLYVVGSFCFQIRKWTSLINPNDYNAKRSTFCTKQLLASSIDFFRFSSCSWWKINNITPFLNSRRPWWKDAGSARRESGRIGSTKQRRYPRRRRWGRRRAMLTGIRTASPCSGGFCRVILFRFSFIWRGLGFR